MGAETPSEHNWAEHNWESLDNLMAWAEMMLHVDDMREQHPEYRFGQAIFNTLQERVPEFAMQIHGTELDTFHLREGVPVHTLFALRDAYLAWKGGE